MNLNGSTLNNAQLYMSQTTSTGLDKNDRYEYENNYYENKRAKQKDTDFRDSFNDDHD
eukprot:CAMPEP_0116931542 /NCGR_PEP_ID=MMETSP0467-20121206/27877_1 /TAXON_ID=283647 /ORGANISM="Mesodinium pulex, Strain SPMC105" /LENGTH=57 /DNA_ID=CAMNT_0004611999 /DNA_START=1978 /DNA_END=2151 /DNA_ORIENTATION=-